MMMKDRSLSDLNLNKILLCTLGFILFCAVLILVLILPILKDYQSTNAKLYIQNSQNANTKSKLEQSEQRLSTLQNANKQIFAHFDNGFKEKDLNTLLNQFFSQVELKKIYSLKENGKKEDYLLYEYEVTANLKEVLNLYNFMDKLKNYQNIIEVDLPINLQAQEQNIKTKFNLKIYSSSPD